MAVIYYDRSRVAIFLPDYSITKHEVSGGT